MPKGASALSGLVLVLSLIPSFSLKAAIIPFDPKQDFGEKFRNEEAIKEQLTEQQLMLIETIMGAPAFWGARTLGSDLIQKEYPSLAVEMKLEPTKVVVSDAGRVLDSSSQIKLKEPVRPPKFYEVKIPVPGWMDSKKEAPEKELEPKKPYRSINVGIGIGRIFDPKISKGYFTYKKLHPYWARMPALNPEHASHVSGVIGAGQNYPFNISPAAQVDDMDIFMGVGGAESSTILEALTLLVNRPEPTRVLNMSHGLTSTDKIAPVLEGLVAVKDTLCSAASGNEGAYISPDQTLSQIPSCTVVGAFGLTGTTTFFSNVGEAVDIVAPGEDIYSRTHEGFAVRLGGQDIHVSSMSGTSMATPMVSGSYALLRTLLPQATSSQIRRLVYETAIDVGYPGKDEDSGRGLINTYRAYEIAKAMRRSKSADSAQAIQKALDDPKTFEATDAIARLALIERMKAGFGTREYELNLRKEILLKGNAEGFEILGNYYETALHYRQLGLAFQFMALNRTTSTSNLAKISAFTERLAPLWLDRMPLERSLFGKIVNPRLGISLSLKMTALAKERAKAEEKEAAARRATTQPSTQKAKEGA